MKQPTMVYRYPSVGRLNYRHGGNLYDYQIVEGYVEGNEQSELDKALDNGWYASPAEAKVKGEVAIKVAAQDMEDTTPPTRAELEMKATELGIEFNRRTKDAALLAKIESVLGV